MVKLTMNRLEYSQHGEIKKNMVKLKKHGEIGKVIKCLHNSMIHTVTFHN